MLLTGDSEETLKQVRKAIQTFLKLRGLSLSDKKTRITSIDQGFDFLGFHIRKYRGKLLCKPAKANIKEIRVAIKEITRTGKAWPTENLITQLNQKLRGWAYYYRHVVSSRTFASVDHTTFRAVWKWAKSRHPRKSSTWIRKRYFRQRGNRKWIFYTKVKGNLVEMIPINTISIKRHIKIRALATPYDPEYKDYFEQRTARMNGRSRSKSANHTGKQNSKYCWV